MRDIIIKSKETGDTFVVDDEGVMPEYDPWDKVKYEDMEKSELIQTIHGLRRLINYTVEALEGIRL